MDALEESDRIMIAGALEYADAKASDDTGTPPGKASPGFTLEDALELLLKLGLLEVTARVEANTEMMRVILSQPEMRSAVREAIFNDVPGCIMDFSPRSHNPFRTDFNYADVMALMFLAAHGDGGSIAVQDLLDKNRDRHKVHSSRDSSDSGEPRTKRSKTTLATCLKWLEQGADPSTYPTIGCGFALIELLRLQQLTVRIKVSSTSTLANVLMQSNKIRDAIDDILFGVIEQPGVRIVWPHTEATDEPADVDVCGAVLLASLAQELEGAETLKLSGKVIRDLPRSIVNKLEERARMVREYFLPLAKRLHALFGTLENGTTPDKKEAKDKIYRIMGQFSGFQTFFPDRLTVRDEAEELLGIQELIKANQPLIHEHDPDGCIANVLFKMGKIRSAEWGLWANWKNTDTMDFIYYYRTGDSTSNWVADSRKMELLAIVIRSLVALSESAYPWLWAEQPTETKEQVMGWIEDISIAIKRIQASSGESSKLAGDIRSIEQLRSYLTAPRLQ